MKKEEKLRGRPKNSKLNKDLILLCAKGLLEKENKIPSIRKIASELNVDAMAIYYYFENKNILLESITISLMEDIYEPKSEVLYFNELKTLCKSYLNLLSKYPGLLEIMLSMTSEGPATVFIYRLKVILKPLNIENEKFHIFIDLLADYLHGFALAMSCDKSNSLNIDRIDKPLGLLIKVLED